MTFRGIGSLTSPIIIDEDDDILPPSRAKVNPNSSTPPPKAPPQEPIDVDSIEVPSTTSSSRRGPSGQLKKGIGYSILVRMGYKPGLGLGVNLEGIRPVTTILLGG
jgi:G-patch domain